MTLSTKGARPEAEEVSVCGGSCRRGKTINQLKAVAPPPDSSETKRIRRSEGDTAKTIRPKCTECGKSYSSWKALYGHMRSHPERSWRGIDPPENLRRSETRIAAADPPPADGWPGEAELEVARCLILLEAQERVNNVGHGSTSSGEVFRCSICDKVFDSYHGLGGHMAGHARARKDAAQKKRKADDPGRLHLCRLSPTSFPGGQAVGGHVLTHREQECTPKGSASDAEAESSSAAGTSGHDFDLNLPSLEEIQGDFILSNP